MRRMGGGGRHPGPTACYPTQGYCFLVQVRTGRRNSLEMREGGSPWEFGHHVSATSTLCFWIANCIVRWLPDQRSSMFNGLGCRALLELRDLGLKLLSSPDASEMRPHTRHTHVTKMGNKTEMCDVPCSQATTLLCGNVCHLPDASAEYLSPRTDMDKCSRYCPATLPSSNFITRLLPQVPL